MGTKWRKYENTHVFYMQACKHTCFYVFCAYSFPHDIIVEKGLLKAHFKNWYTFTVHHIRSEFQVLHTPLSLHAQSLPYPRLRVGRVGRRSPPRLMASQTGLSTCWRTSCSGWRGCVWFPWRCSWRNGNGTSLTSEWSATRPTALLIVLRWVGYEVGGGWGMRWVVGGA